MHALPGLARGLEDGGDQNGVEPTAGTELQVGDDRGDGGEMSASLGEDQAAEHAGGIHAKSVSDAAAEALVHQHGIGMKFQGEGERLRLAAVKVGSSDGRGNVTGRNHLQPCRQNRMLAQKLGLDRRRDNDLAEKQTE